MSIGATSPVAEYARAVSDAPVSDDTPTLTLSVPTGYRLFVRCPVPGKLPIRIELDAALDRGSVFLADAAAREVKHRLLNPPGWWGRQWEPAWAGDLRALLAALPAGVRDRAEVLVCSVCDCDARFPLSRLPVYRPIPYPTTAA